MILQIISLFTCKAPLQSQAGRVLLLSQLGSHFSLERAADLRGHGCIQRGSLELGIPPVPGHSVWVCLEALLLLLQTPPSVSVPGSALSHMGAAERA